MFKDSQYFLQLGGKIDPLSEIRNAGVVTSGSVFWVKPVTDADFTTFQAQVGQQSVFGTVQGAIDKARNDKNDYVLLTIPDNNSPYSLGSSVGVAGTGLGTTALVINKNRLHLRGVGLNANSDQYAVTFRGFATAAGGTPLDSAYIKILAGGVELAGFKLTGTVGTAAGGTVTDGFIVVGTASTGTAHDLWMHDMTIESGVALAFGTPALLDTPGTVHGLRADNVNFFVPNDTLEKAHAGVIDLGPGGKRWRFNECTITLFSGSTADHFITTGSGAKEFTLFKNCNFFNIGTVTMASGVVGSVTVGNPIAFRDHTIFGSVTGMGTDPSVFKAPVASGTSTAVRDYGIAVGTAALIPA